MQVAVTDGAGIGLGARARIVGDELEQARRGRAERSPASAPSASGVRVDVSATTNYAATLCSEARVKPMSERRRQEQTSSC